MLAPLAPTKLRPDHLARPALVYVRQSTLAQVRDNTASTARQYDLVQRARDLGWPADAITVIDQDLGRSGASATVRDGFQHLVATVGLGHAGAVFSLEASRLARASSDWYRLIELCALTQTLVIDEDGIYDPGQYNDRLLLGFKGTMSEAELHWLRARLLGGKLAKAQQGTLRARLPTGLVYDPVGRVVLDPDESVQAAIRLVFDLFAEHGTALRVVRQFADQHLRIPTRAWGGVHDGELTWQPLRHSRVLAMLHDPAYAGAYVYGRTQTRQYTLPGEAPRVKGRTRQVALADWTVVHQDAHPGYLTWEQFLGHQQRLDGNRTFRAEERSGAAREGAALLQGIVLCGQCGRRMGVRYPGDGRRPYYECTEAHTQLCARTCQSIRGDGLDAAVAQQFLAALQPAALAVALAALDDLAARARQVDRQWQLRLERARYEADLARRRFLATEPENRLVARSLERQWNDCLAAVEQLEREMATRPGAPAQGISTTDRQRILDLAQDLPTLWHAPTTAAAERKQLLRCLIKDVTLTKQARSITVAIRWQTEAVTTLDCPRPPRSPDVRRTPAPLLARLRELAETASDRLIADQLTQEGWLASTGRPYRTTNIKWLRYRYGIISSCPDGPLACPSGQRSDGRYAARAVAEQLNITVSTVAAWCQTGVLDGVQTAPHGPWWVRLTPEQRATLRKPTRRRWTRHARPTTAATKPSAK